MKRLPTIALGLLVCVLGCTRRPAVVQERPATDPLSQLVQSMTVVATGLRMESARLEKVTQQIAQGTMTIEEYVDALVQDSRLANIVLPRILLSDTGGRKYPLSSALVLKTVEGDESRPEILYLHKPCDPAQAVAVEPWWAMGTRVWVCPSAYRPDYFVDEHGYYCGSNLASGCGCGPHLAFCSGSTQHFEEIQNSLAEEARLTAAYIIRTDLPIEELFVGNATVRDANAELIYRRWRILAGEQVSLDDLPAWPKDGKPKPRYESVPGQHAGILTTQRIAFGSDAPRPLQRDFANLLFCTSPASVHVEAQTILSLGALNLRLGDGWKALAAMPVCTNCHARLDYGMQFFTGYPTVQHARDFLPKAQLSGEGDFYMRDIRDLRGRGPLSPLGYAKLAVQQPEFAACMARRIAEQVFGDAYSREDVQALQQTVTAQHSLKSVMRTALLRLARRQLHPVAAAPASPSLKQLIDTHCVDCHDGGKVDLSVTPLPRETLQAVLTQVSSGAMPRTTLGFSPPERRAFVGAVLDELWQREPQALVQAREQFGAAPPLLHSFEASLGIARALGGPARAALDWNNVERQLRQDYMRLTPNMVTMLSLEALAACKANRARWESLEACLRSSGAPEHYIKTVP